MPAKIKRYRGHSIRFAEGDLTPVLWSPPLCGYGAGLSNVKILITLSYGEGSVGSEEFMAEDLGEEDIVGDIFGFELVAAEGAVGAAQVAGFPGEGQGSRRRRTRTLGVVGRWWC
jgi:hypothetical protein